MLPAAPGSLQMKGLPPDCLSLSLFPLSRPSISVSGSIPYECSLLVLYGDGIVRIWIRHDWSPARHSIMESWVEVVYGVVSLEYGFGGWLGKGGRRSWPRLHLYRTVPCGTKTRRLGRKTAWDRPAPFRVEVDADVRALIALPIKSPASSPLGRDFSRSSFLASLRASVKSVFDSVTPFRCGLEACGAS